MRWHRAPDLQAAYPPPHKPWGDPVYMAAHERFVCDMLDSPAILERFAVGARLPRGFGVGLDERVVEYPWLFAQQPTGRVLDAGSTLNHPHVLARLLPLLDALQIVTLAPEPFTHPRATYEYADLRELPYPTGWFDTVVSISTLEHVGMDNSRYGDSRPRSPSPPDELARAARELRRVTRPGGRLLVTVPFGASEDHGWFRQFAKADVDKLLEALDPLRSTVQVFTYARRGWQRSTMRRAATAVYRDAERDPRPAADLAVAARAVACIVAVTR